MRKFFKKLHLYIALILCLPLVLQGLSGIFLVFEHEITDAFLSKKHQFSQENSLQNDAETLIETAQKELGEEFKPSFIFFPVDENAPVRIRFSKGQERKQVSLDPASLEVIESGAVQNPFFSFIKKFHTNLLIEGKPGRNIIGTFGLIMLFMGISGLIIWWPKSGKPFTKNMKIREGAQGYILHRDLHASVGFWTLIPFMIISFAGVYLAFTPQTSAFITTFFEGRDLKATANAISVEPQEKSISVNQAIELAKSAVSQDEKLLSLMIPGKKEQPYRVNFAPKNYDDGEPAITVFIDQWQNKIIEKRDPKEYSTGEKIMAWQHPLHVGEGLGLAWKISVFLMGFLPLLFSITGITMWLGKKNKKKAA